MNPTNDSSDSFNSSNLPGKGYRILISDDYPDLCDAIRPILENQGYTCRTAQLAIETVQAIDSFTPHLLTTDIMKPGLDGLEMAKMIREAIPALPIIIFSAKFHGDSKPRARDMGVARFICKPFVESKFIQAINEVIKEWYLTPDQLRPGIQEFNGKDIDEGKWCLKPMGH